MFVGPTSGRKLHLLIPDWMRHPPEGVAPTKDPNGWGLKKQRVALQEGLNVIQVSKSSNAYVSYFEDDAAQAPGIVVHFATGKVNGFFDIARHNNDDWNRLLDQAVGPIMDARGKHIQVADPEVVVRGDPCWGFGHEVGHVLQPRPQLTWGGLTEVSCNIFTMYTLTAMGNPSRLKAQDNYASARRNIIESDPKISFLACPDVFDRLVPFWQLHLYFSRQGKADFYADVMETMRRRPDAGRGDDSINNQFEFIKICCDVGQTDLTNFFEKWGFFWVGELTVKDYREYHFKMTQAMVDETKSYIAGKNYPEPDEDITLIED